MEYAKNPKAIMASAAKTTVAEFVLSSAKTPAVPSDDQIAVLSTSGIASALGSRTRADTDATLTDTSVMAKSNARKLN